MPGLGTTRPTLVLALLASALGASGAAAQDPDGYAIEDRTLVARCSRCHVQDDDGRMSRISYMRKTPEGWQTSIRRMAVLHNVSMTPEEARAIVRYLSNRQGLAPEELEPGRFEVERRLVDHDYEGDSDTEFTCIQCHSMGRVITQRRTKEEWELLLTTHRALYPLVDFQAFRRSGPPPDDAGEDGRPPDARHPMERAVDHLSRAFPLETPEWSAWAATMRSPRLEGEWALSGYEPGKGPLYGRLVVSADASDPDAFTTSATYRYPETGESVQRSGQALVYTGYQWRGRSNPDTESELREVIQVSRDQQTMTGRWFTGAYDEIGPDVTARRVSGPVISGVFPRALERGGTVEVTIFGQGGSADTPFEPDFGAGVSATVVEGPTSGEMRVRLTVAPDATVGARDLFVAGSTLREAIVVHDGVDRIVVTPATGMARVGGENFPKQYQTFEAIGWDDGPDGEPETDDDLELGRVPVRWSMEEYAATFGDDDIRFVGTMGQDGTFVPAVDGPNPERVGNRNNVGDVWVVATHERTGAEPLRARAHLLVTVPLYMRWEPWREVAR